MGKSNPKGKVYFEKGGNEDIGKAYSDNGGNEDIEWELRPGGMLVQKRDVGVSATGPMIKIKVSHGSSQHEITVPAQATFGDLKGLLAPETGLEPKEQRLLFRGKEKDDDECLHMVGVKDMSKVILLEDPASKERKLEEMNRDQGIARACEAVAQVRAEVDKFAGKVSAVEVAVHGGTKVAEKEFLMLTEMLMRQLLKLDTIEAEGEAKVQRRIEDTCFAVFAFIRRIIFNDIYYDGCFHCEKKVKTDEYGNAVCPRCKRINPRTNLRYVLYTDVEDWTGNIPATLFNDIAEKVLGYSVSALLETFPDAEELQKEIKKDRGPFICNISYQKNSDTASKYFQYIVKSVEEGHFPLTD